MIRALLDKIYDLLVYLISFSLIFGTILFHIYVLDRQVVKEATEQFVDRVKYEGYITRDMYETYLEKISVAPYRVYMRHIVYSTDSSGWRRESPYTEYAVKDSLYSPGNTYYMRKGDDFQVIVAEMGPSPFFVFMQFVANTPARPAVVTSQGGMILNESY